MIRTLFFPIARHVVGMLVAWLAAALTLTDLQVTELNETLTAAALIIFAGVWTIVQKALKLPFRRWLGEQQPGDTDPMDKP